MGKLYFKYGTMGAAKSATILTVKFNYEESGKTVWLIKPSADTRDEDVIRSRIGIEAKCNIIRPDNNILSLFTSHKNREDVILADESQFFTEEQINQLRSIVDQCDVPVLCYGLRTDFTSHFFPGSKRLMEISDELEEIKAMCRCCGKHKATVNARLIDGKVVTSGEQIIIGGNEHYSPMCHKCWASKKNRQFFSTSSH